MFERNTPWRQGLVLTDKDALGLGLVSEPNTVQRFVVISHDCDLPHDKELCIEFIAGTVIQVPNAMFEHARNPRSLHLTYKTTNEHESHIQLLQTDRVNIEKTKLTTATPDPELILDPDSKHSLKQWLASRYARPAYPNAFETRLRKEVGKYSVEKHIGKILEPESKFLVSLFFDLGTERDTELVDGTAYNLSITVAYDAIEGGQPARNSAEKVANQLRELFEKAYGKSQAATEIALEKCKAVADTHINLSEIRRISQWRLEYISLKEEPVGQLLGIDNLI